MLSDSSLGDHSCGARSPKTETVTEVHHRDEPDGGVRPLVMGMLCSPLSMNTRTSLYYSLVSSLEHLGIVEKPSFQTGKAVEQT